MAREQILAQLAQAMGISGLSAPKVPKEGEHSFFMFLAGLTSVADWIGSNTEFFPFAIEETDITGYAALSRTRAAEAVRKLGWTVPEARQNPRQFREVFPEIASPRPLQRVVEQEAQAVAGPALVLIEAPMGEGKTEAALYLSDCWTARLRQPGAYLALPTQATSNQMFTRVRRFLGGRYPDDRVNLLLLHGGAMLSEEFDELRLAGVHDEENLPSGIVAEEWFLGRKRGLLGAFGVGTIDQVLMAVLQTRHVFVRLFGLAGKTVILDEVHAYDTYMSTLLERLLEWLAALGCSVVLLSATLPQTRRRALIQAYLGSEPAEAPLPYPRITVAAGKEVRCLAIETAPDRRRRVAVQWVEEQELAARLGLALLKGGCAAVICNTVGRAQQTYMALRNALGPAGINVELFHARFPFGRRDEIEKRVLAQYGKPGACERPAASILVATQVIEQSLDLDFDLMVTELAPVDLLLQRTGRLHRHHRKRPPGLSVPALWVLAADRRRDSTPDFGASEWVYERHILLRSYLALAEHQAILLPDDVEALVEAVYGDVELPADEAWARALAESHGEAEKVRRECQQKARACVIKPPDYEDDLLEDFCQQLEEDNPEAHQTIQAATRLTEPTVSAVLVYRQADGLFLDAECTHQVDERKPPTRGETLALLGNAVKLSHGGCCAVLCTQRPPLSWQTNAMLRYHRLVVLDNGQVDLGGYRVRLDDELGIVIGKAEHARGVEP